MSFGFETRQPEVQTAIARAYSEGVGKETILFAAASNDGFHGSRLFPASDGRVFGIYALDGNGKDTSSFNPPTESRDDNFGTLGLGLELYWQKGFEIKSGTSYATPIAAGIAVNILEWLGYVHDEGMLTAKDYSRLKCPSSIRKIMRKLAHEPNNSGDVSFVVPWRLWKPMEDSETWGKVAQDICGLLLRSCL